MSKPFCGHLFLVTRTHRYVRTAVPDRRIRSFTHRARACFAAIDLGTVVAEG
jgi:hypothetical protein